MGIVAAGAGAQQGLEEYLMNILREQQVAESARHTRVSEGQADRQLDLTAENHKEMIRSNNLRQQSLEDYRRQQTNNQVRDDKRAALDDLLPGALISPQTRKEAIDTGAAAPERFKERSTPFVGPVPEGETQPQSIDEFTLVGKPPKEPVAKGLQQKAYKYKGKPIDADFDPASGKVTYRGQDITNEVDHYDNPGQPSFSPVQSGDNFIRFNRKTGKFEDSTGAEVQNPALPTPSATRTREDLASRVGSHFDDIQQMLDEAENRGLLGPMAGRTYVDFLAGKVGSTGDAKNDELLGELRTNLSLARSGLSQLHGRGGANVGIIQNLEKKMDEGHMSYNELTGGLRAMKGWVDTYAKKAGGTAAAPAGDDAYQAYLKRTAGKPKD